MKENLPSVSSTLHKCWQIVNNVDSSQINVLEEFEPGLNSLHRYTCPYMYVKYGTLFFYLLRNVYMDSVLMVYQVCRI